MTSDAVATTTVGDLSPEDFYAELTRRNAGLVSPAQQAALRHGTVLVAGCGSVGGAAVQPLTRLGAQRFLLADPGLFELNNLNRQPATVRDLDRNKAEVAGERILEINPHARVRVFPEGVTRDNVDELTATCGAIVDGVDVTTPSGLQAKFLLHEWALRRRVPLITGWDMAGVQYLQCYDYREVTAEFGGRITRSDVDTLNVWELILRMIPMRRIPPEMLADVSPNLRNPDYSVPQLVYAALMFGAFSAHVVARLMAGERVNDEVVFDLHRAVRLPPEAWRTRARWPIEAWRMAVARRRLAKALARQPS
ncbi:ThiF family protein [Saccharothrix saharensis]|uniref:ThiF family protein n=1 Tax=Saccharothrix saharensis TaxID=571190 RepID=A0A543J6D6_9PSEU|nr:ThiF family adenylyltransferase [Saccharothrix saharensis]TQM78404.1 ThiF family protein [Saccharothrix saharensis]